jgi:hypothetical protein
MTETTTSAATSTTFDVAPETQVELVSSSAHVTGWCVGYSGAWWPARSRRAAAPDRVVVAEADHDEYARIDELVRSGPAETCEFLRAPVLSRRLDTGEIVAVQRGERVAYRSVPDRSLVEVVGIGEHEVALCTARVLREAGRAALEADGWALVHGSAVTTGDRALVTLGAKGAGKTTTALSLALDGKWGLLANDRIFVRPRDGQVDVVPWPSAAALGLGLLTAFGLYDIVRDRVLGGDHLHDSQDDRVTAALLAGHRAPLWDDRGRELKIQAMPRQLTEWFGLRLTSSAVVGAVFNPRIVPGVRPHLAAHRPTVTGDDFFHPHDPTYPDFLRLRRIGDEPRAGHYARARAALERVPGIRAELGHDVAANVAALADVTGYF